MARLGNPVPVPDFGYTREGMESESRWYDKFCKDNEGKIVRFQVADGYAEYLVEDGGKTLRHIPVFDGYMIPDAHVRGLRVADINGMIAQEKRMKDLFRKKA